MANISYRTGKQSGSVQIREALQPAPAFAEAFERTLDHLHANRIDFERTPLTLGASLRFDVNAERFVGPLSAEANRLLTRDYRKPFAVSEKL